MQDVLYQTLQFIHLNRLGQIVFCPILMARTASDTEAYPVMMMKGTSIRSLCIHSSSDMPSPAEDGHRKGQDRKAPFQKPPCTGFVYRRHCFIAGFLKPFLLLSGQQDIVFNYEYSVFHPYSSLSQVSDFRKQVLRIAYQPVYSSDDRLCICTDGQIIGSIVM